MENPSIDIVARELRLLHSDTLGAIEFHGSSMTPFLRDGDELVIEPVAFDDVAVGDVVTFRLEEKFPTYRVVKKRPHKLVLRGDNWPGRIFFAWREDVVGRVVARRRGDETLRRGDPAWRAAAAYVRLRDGARTAKHRVTTRIVGLRRRLGRELARRRSEFLDLPASVQIGISNPCNLACRMCPYLEVHDFSRELLDAETFAKFLPVVRHLPNVHLSGFGETLLNKQLLAFIERLRATNPKITIAVTNNGTLLKEPIARGLVAAGIDRLVVSLDGATAETVESIRLGIDFDEVIANVRRFSAIKRELGATRPIIRLNYMVGYGTYEELVPLVRLARDVGAGEIRLLEMQPATEADTRENLLANLERDGGRNLREAMKLAQHHGIWLELPTTNEGRCLHPYTPHTSADGTVFPCCYLAYDRKLFSGGREVTLPSLAFGNVREQSFAEIWNAPAYREFRERTARGDFTDFCKACHETRIHTSRKLAEHF